MGYSLFDDFIYNEKSVAYAKPNSYTFYLFGFGIFLGSVAEELFWRGYLLPIQEKKLGYKAWWLNGIMWALSHSFALNPIRILLTSLSYSYVSYKYKNLWFTIIFHLFINSITTYTVLKKFGI